jgi:hypothetical protein
MADLSLSSLLAFLYSTEYKQKYEAKSKQKVSQIISHIQNALYLRCSLFSVFLGDEGRLSHKRRFRKHPTLFTFNLVVD